MKIIFLSIRIALDGISTHKLRSALTMLGIIFGVTAVVSMLAIGSGAQQEILKQIEIMGINNIYIYDEIKVRAQKLTAEGKFISEGLSLKDVRTMQKILQSHILTVPVLDTRLLVHFRNYKEESAIVGTTFDYFTTLNLKIKEGRFFNQVDIIENSRVAVVGGGLYNRLKREGTVLGESIKIKDEWFTIIGIMESKATLAKKDDNMNYEDFNYNIYIPFSSPLLNNQDNVLNPEVNRIIVHCKNKELVGQTSLILERVLQRHHNDIRDYKITIPEELLKQHKETQRIFDIVLGSIAGISLLVGGIGIMNIMLASILERTKEIGLRRATGATRMHIRLQFLLEAVLLTVFGGLLGILLSFIITFVIKTYWAMPAKITMSSCIVSFSIAAGVGILFGYLPAKKAADMNPIDSLRYE